MTSRKKQRSRRKEARPRRAVSRSPAPAGSKRVWRLAIYILSLLVIQEIVFRLFFPLPEIRNFNRFAYQSGRDAARRSNYVRNIDLVWRSTLDTDETFVSQLNEYGFRDGEWSLSKPANTTRAFFVGDSFVEGMMAHEDQVVSRQFARKAGESGADVEAMNFGVMGVGLEAYMDLIVDAVPIFAPDEVFLLLYSNDVPFNEQTRSHRPIEPEFSNPFKPRLVELFALLRNDEPIAARWMHKSRKYYPAVPDPNNPWTRHDAELAPQVSVRVASAMKRGDFNVFRTGWVLKEEQFLKRPADLTRQLEFLRDFTKEHGSRLSVFYVPSRHQVSTYYYAFEKQMCTQCPETLDMTGEAYQIHRRMLATACAELRIPFEDLTPAIRGQEDLEHHLYWDHDDHMRPDGYRLIGEAIYSGWRLSGPAVFERLR